MEVLKYFFIGAIRSIFHMTSYIEILAIILIRLLERRHRDLLNTLQAQLSFIRVQDNLSLTPLVF